jgi:uncharacterized membrane protein YraQ (UPF0718 family)
MFNQLLTQQFYDAAEFFIMTLSELAILFLMISIIVSIINQKLPPAKIKNLLSGQKGYTIAVALGSVTPFCSCSTLPMTIGLIKARAAFGPVMAFLFTSPLLNPFIVGLFWISFGAKVTLIYSIFVISLAIISGIILEKLKFERFIRSDLLQDTNAVVSSEETSNTNVNNDKQQIKTRIKWQTLHRDSFKQFISFLPFMAIGVAIGAVLHGYAPTSFFADISTTSVYLLIPLAAVIGVFLYVRASTMVPIAVSLAAKGMSMGAIMSLTIAGAGASLPEMIMMKRMFHWPLLLVFIFLVFLTATLTGFAIELL